MTAVRRFYYQLFTLQPPEILALEVPSGSFVLFMSRETMEDYGNGIRPNADAGLGPSIQFAPVIAGEWYLVCDSRLDGAFRVMQGLRTLRSGQLQLAFR